MEIAIGRGKTKVLLDEDDYVKFFVKGNFFSIASHGYVRCMNYVGVYEKTGNGRYSNRYLHRMVMNAPKNLMVDHINGNRLDNRKENLRLCSVQNNSVNKKGRMGYKGIYFSKDTKKWIAQITKRYHTKSLGSFKTPEEAALAYNKAAKRIHGKYAFLNIIKSNVKINI